jgi:hypothetical protein
MKRLVLSSLILMGCYSLPFTSTCDKTEDKARIERTISYVEQDSRVIRTNVRYRRPGNMAIVTGYDIQQRPVRSEKVPQSCKL